MVKRMTPLAEIEKWRHDRLPGVLAEHRIPGAAIAVAVGETVVDHAAGVLNTATGVEATVDSVGRSALLRVVPERDMQYLHGGRVSRRVAR